MAQSRILVLESQSKAQESVVTKLMGGGGGGGGGGCIIG